VDTVEVGAPVDRSHPDLGEKLEREGLQPRLGVPVSRRRIAVERAEVPVPVDERRAEGEGLGHPDERVVDRDVAVRVVLPDDVTNDRRRLLELGVRRQMEVLEHREEDPTLHRFEPVAHVRQGARRDDRQGVVQVAPPHLVGQRRLRVERKRRLPARRGRCFTSCHRVPAAPPFGTLPPRR
jgi:hypothetical protein